MVKKDLLGKVFGRLTVVEQGESHFSENGRPYIKWKCQCTCGKEIIALADNLVRNRTKSCGCATGEAIRQAKRLPKGESSFNMLYRNYKKKAIDRNLDFELTKEQFRILTSSNCFYCNKIPSNIYRNVKPKATKEAKEWSIYFYNGIDRKDNSKGYTVENSATCCWNCNNFKSNVVNGEEMLEIIKILKQLRNKEIFGNNMSYQFINKDGNTILISTTNTIGPYTLNNTTLSSVNTNYTYNLYDTLKAINSAYSINSEEEYQQCLKILQEVYKEYLRKNTKMGKMLYE